MTMMAIITEVLVFADLSVRGTACEKWLIIGLTYSGLVGF